jgi:hypothetical protein
MIRQPVTEPLLTIEEVDAPAEIARCRAQDERAKRNSAWLKAHWPELLPRSRGKFLAVAGEEAFIAETAAEVWRMAQAAHPDDDGAFSQYVFPEGGPRIYACRW